MRDTTSDAEEVRLRAIRTLTPIQRLQAALDLSESVRNLALKKIRELHPGLTHLESVELLLGERLIPPGTHRPRE